MRRTCTEPGCEEPAFGRGLCSRHYQLASYHGTLPARPEPRPCKQCGEQFTSRKWNAEYCSRTCNERARVERNQKARYPSPTLQCEQCGTTVDKKRIDARFCSNKCGQDWRNAQTSARTLAAKAAAPRPCKGCGHPIPPERMNNALYHSEACKIASRRHEAYGLTKEELGVLLAQHEQCAICRSEDWGKKGPQVDHDHATGRVRGVLCGNCNQGLGRFKDDPTLLRAAINYLKGAPVPS